MILLLVAAALAAAIAALAWNARRYVRWANAKWPPQGRFVEAHGAMLHVREAGLEGAPRLLLIHGASSNLLELWGPLANEFSPLHRVIAYDRPGMGHSTRADRRDHDEEDDDDRRQHWQATQCCPTSAGTFRGYVQALTGPGRAHVVD